MTPAEAGKIYDRGNEVVIAALCNLSATIEKQKKQINALELKIAKLSKNSGKSRPLMTLQRKLNRKRVLLAK